MKDKKLKLFTSRQKSKEYIPAEGEMCKYILDNGNMVIKLGDGQTPLYNLPCIKSIQKTIPTHIHNDKCGLGCLASPFDARDYQFSDLVASVDRQQFQSEYIPKYNILLHLTTS